MAKNANQKKEEREAEAGSPEFDEILAKKKHATHTVPICMDYELVLARDKARGELRGIQMGLGIYDDENPMPDELAEQLKAAEEKLAKCDEAVAAESVDFVFRSIGREAYENLMDSLPPSKKQVESFKAKVKALGLPQTGALQYDDDRFPPALIAACATAPVISVKQATQLWKSAEFSRAETAKLFQAAIDANNLIAQ